jgi:hypothetical protein
MPVLASFVKTELSVDNSNSNQPEGLFRNLPGPTSEPENEDLTRIGHPACSAVSGVFWNMDRVFIFRWLVSLLFYNFHTSDYHVSCSPTFE